MLRLWVKDNTTGEVHEYGTNPHDALILQEDGSLHYENVQCVAGTKYPAEGYSFCREDGTIPDATAIDTGDEVLDIGGSKDFTPVVHGRWLHAGIFDDFAKCSVCGCMEFPIYDAHRLRYCFSCGAKMDVDVLGRKNHE